MSDKNQGRESVKTAAELKDQRLTIKWCLRKAKTHIARSVQELDFLELAEADDAVSKPGIVFDRQAKIVVALWEKTRFENRPAEWLMWIGQPFGKELSPFKIVESGPPQSFVAYLYRPSPSSRRRAEQCIRFSEDGSNDPPRVTLDRADIEDGEPEG